MRSPFGRIVVQGPKQSQVTAVVFSCTHCYQLEKQSLTKRTACETPAFRERRMVLLALITQNPTSALLLDLALAANAA